MIYTGRDYQHEAVASTLKHIEAGSKGILLALATGTGKSVIAGMLATHMETMLFIVDREELAFQAKEKLESITQRRVALECGTEYKAFKTSPDAKFVVAMSQSLIRRLSAYGPNRFDYIMEDECFPAGTMVGGVPIETIKVGDQVESFNHESQAVEYRTVVRISSRETKQLVRVVLKNGHSFVCTKCHPFFASGEYIQAIDLNSSHVLFQVNSDVSQGKTIRNFVRGVQYSDSSIGGYTPTASSVQSEENWSDILFKGLHDGKCQEAEFRKDGENKQKVRQKTYVRTQSYATEREQGEGFTSNEGTPIVSSLWKRNRHDYSSDYNERGAVGNVSGSCGRVCNSNKDEVSYAEIIRDGSVVSGKQDVYRDRRSKSLPTGKTRAGQEEGRIHSWHRVDYVEVLEQTSDGEFGGLCPGSVVYNLEVEGNHNYFVDGYLVHNCHHSVAATRTAIRNHFTGSRATIGYTATPKRADGRAAGEVYDTVAFKMDAMEGTELGWLTPFRSRVLACNEMDLRQVKLSCGEFNQAALRLQLEKQAVVERIARQTVAIADGRQTVIFAQTVEQSKAIDRFLRSIGERSTHVDGKLPKFARRDRLSRFSNCEHQFVVNCSLIEEGVDVPGIEVVAMAAPVRSTPKFIQRCGRGLRPVIDLTGTTPEQRRQQIAGSRKPWCTVIDFIGQMDEHCSSMCFSGDLLGGEFDDEERKVAIRLASGQETPDMPSIMAEAKEIVRKRRTKMTPLQLKEEARKRYQKAGRALEQVWAIKTAFCPYAVLHLDKKTADREVTKDETYGRSFSASESYLKACHLTPGDMSKLSSKEIVYLARVLRARAETHSSYIQSRHIHARGYDASNLTKMEANSLMNRIVEAGYVRPVEDGPNELYERSQASKSEPVTKKQNFTFV